MVNHYKIQSGVKHAKTTLSRAKTVTALGVAGLLSAIALPLAAHAATTSTVVVSPNNNQGWLFNRDPNNVTPYNFTNDAYSIGAGSLYVQPIGATDADKFIAEKTVNVPNAPVSSLSSISYDFKIADNGTAASANKFYLNVYTKVPGSTRTGYDCRFDYEPTIGSITQFTTATFSSTSVPVNVRAKSLTCGTTLATMPAGSTITNFALNVGDTTNSDAGLAGYLDNVVVRTGANSNSITYDFELANTPKNKEDCKKGGFVNFKDANGVVFKNQGSCVSASNQLKELSGEMNNVRETENRNEVENN